MTFLPQSGAIGAYLRLCLVPMNNIRSDFPVGTFLANIIGSWILAAVVTLAKLGVDYNDQLSQSFLYGLEIGYATFFRPGIYFATYHLPLCDLSL